MTHILNLFTHISHYKYHHYLVFFLCLIGFTIRLLGISIIPSGLNQDEASIGYEAFSIMTSGHDRNGISFPIHFISWGSGQNALYAYLSMPFISIFGLNTFSVRIVNALLSCMSLLVFYWLLKLSFNKKVALIGLALLTISPWSIMSARWGLESNIFPTIFLFGVYFLLKGIYSSQLYFPLSFSVFAISLYAYGTSYLILPIFFVLVIPFLLYQQRISIKTLLFSALAFLTIATPIILFVIINHLDLPALHFGNLSIPRLDSNRTTVVFNVFSSDFISIVIKNTVRFLNVLVLQNDGNEYNAIPAFGTIYQLSLPFSFIGIYGILKSERHQIKPVNFIFLMWLISSIILGVSSHININRINILIYPLIYFTTLGLIETRKMLRPEFIRGYSALIISFYTMLFVLFSGYYFIFFRANNKNHFSYGLGEAIQYANNLKPKRNINITEYSINMPYIYVCFYTQLNPTTFQNSVIYIHENSGEFKKVSSLGRYTFGKTKDEVQAIKIISKEEIEIYNLDVSSYKCFGNYYVIEQK